jgi:PAS domain-containing protein
MDYNPRMASARHGSLPGKVEDIRLVIDTIPGLVWSTRPDGSAEFFNQRCLEYTGLARIAWNYVPSEENNKVFGRPQSFVAGSAPAWYLQFMVKDSKKVRRDGQLGVRSIRQGRPTWLRGRSQ